MTDFKGLFEVRDSKPSDKNFVLATFLRGLYYGDSWFSSIPKQVFMDNYKVLAQRLLGSDRVVIKVACLPDDPDVILGYSILSSDYQTVHWCYCKSAWRRNGIARSLLPSYPSSFTHLSSLGRSLMSKFKDAEFNPFKISEAL